MIENGFQKYLFTGITIIVYTFMMNLMFSTPTANSRVLPVVLEAVDVPAVICYWILTNLSPIIGFSVKITFCNSCKKMFW